MNTDVLESRGTGDLFYEQVSFGTVTATQHCCSSQSINFVGPAEACQISVLFIGDGAAAHCTTQKERSTPADIIVDDVS